MFGLIGLVFTAIMVALTGWAAGWLARKAVPGVRSGGPVVDALTGIAGAMIGWVISFFISFPFAHLWLIGPIIPAFVGAVILLLILKASAGSKVRY